MADKKIWQYRFPSEKWEGWALVKDDFRKFFLRCEADYIASKLKPEKHIDDELSLQAVKRYILAERRHGGYSKYKARARWNHVKCFDQRTWHEFLDDERSHALFDEPWEFGVSVRNAQVVAFAQKIVCERLRAAIQKELEEERHQDLCQNGSAP